MSNKVKCPACDDYCQLWVGCVCVGEDDEGLCHLYETPVGRFECRPQEVSFVPLKPVCDGFFDVCDTLEAINVRLGRIEDMLKREGGE